MHQVKQYSFMLVFACVFAMSAQILWAQVGVAPTPQAVTPGARTAPAGTQVEAQFTSTPPTLTPDQEREMLALWGNANRTGPMQPVHPAPMTTPAERGAETNPPSLTPAPNTFTIYRDSVIPASGIDGGYSFTSYTMEPSTGTNGRYTLQTGNWYASKFDQNANSGAGGWTFLNPFAIFGSGFCCDQVTLYMTEWNREYWLLQYGDHLALANSTGSDLFMTSWCFYNIDASWWGLDPTVYSLDYNDMAYSNNYIYVTTNIFGPNGGFGGMLRLPISKMNSCSSLNYNFYTDTSHFTFKLVQGATDIMYWASNWGGTNGSNIRLYSYAESGAFNVYDIGIDAFNFEYRNNNQFCGSADGVVKNWCQFNDSRVKGGYLSRFSAVQGKDLENGVIGFTFDATQGSGYPFPYVRIVEFRQSDKAYLGSAKQWASWGAFQYGSYAPSANGFIGGALSWGGGVSGGTDYYPGTAYLLYDDFSPTQPWAISYEIWGGGNTCQYGGLWRWGDYNTVRATGPDGFRFGAGGWAITGGNCYDTGKSVPHNVVFGRGRDTGDNNRWKGK